MLQCKDVCWVRYIQVLCSQQSPAITVRVPA